MLMDFRSVNTIVEGDHKTPHAREFVKMFFVRMHMVLQMKQ